MACQNDKVTVEIIVKKFYLLALCFFYEFMQYLLFSH
jgi:hypothetical protein